MEGKIRVGLSVFIIAASITGLLNDRENLKLLVASLNLFLHVNPTKENDYNNFSF